MKYTVLVGLSLSLAACASNGASWNQKNWFGQQVQNFNSGPWKFSAAPVRGNGFKLQFKINLNDIAAGSSADSLPEDPTEAEMIDAAIAAAPDGCTFQSLSKTDDGYFQADYSCE